MKVLIILFTIFWLSYSFSCSLVNQKIDVSSEQKVIYSDVKTTDSDKTTSISQEFQSVLKKSINSNWQITVRQIDKNNDFDLSYLYFFDEKFGFVSTADEKLLKTTNGGKNWEILKIPTDLSPYNILFMSDQNGYLILNRIASSVLDVINDETFILRTKDGGATWEALYNSKSSSLVKIVFVSKDIGFAIGVKNSLAPNLRQSHLFSVTEDGGLNWSDLSENLNRLAFKQKERSSDYLTDIHLNSDGEISVLSLRGDIFKTTNKGKTWETFDKLTDEPPQTCLCHLDKIGNNFVIGGGTQSKEGVWGVVAFQSEKNKWEKYRLNGYYFSDIKFISETEIIAVGASNSKGVILFSADRGKSWELLHKSKISKVFNSISVASKNDIRISGSNGNIISLTKK